jgi:hypothetical protein
MRARSWDLVRKRDGTGKGVMEGSAKDGVVDMDFIKELPGPDSRRVRTRIVPN